MVSSVNLNGTPDLAIAQAHEAPSKALDEVASILNEVKPESKDSKKVKSKAAKRKWTYNKTSTIKEAYHDKKLRLYAKQKLQNILVFLGNLFQLYRRWGHDAEQITTKVAEKPLEVKPNADTSKEKDIDEGFETSDGEEVKPELEEVTTVVVEEARVEKEEPLLASAPVVEDEGFEDDVLDTIQETSSALEDLLGEAEQINEYRALLKDGESLPAIIRRQSEYTRDIAGVEETLKPQETAMPTVVETARKTDNTTNWVKECSIGAGIAGVAFLYAAPVLALSITAGLIASIGLVGAADYYFSPQETQETSSKELVKVFESEQEVSDFVSSMTDVFSDPEFQAENRALIIEYSNLVKQGVDNEKLFRVLIDVESFDKAMTERASDKYAKIKDRLILKYRPKAVATA